MNIYKLSQDVNNTWDTYDSCIVYANSEEEAQKIHPSGYEDGKWWEKDDSFPSWAYKLEEVKVELIGYNPNVSEPKLILASFNAG